MRAHLMYQVWQFRVLTLALCGDSVRHIALLWVLDSQSLWISHKTLSTICTAGQIYYIYFLCIYYMHRPYDTILSVNAKRIQHAGNAAPSFISVIWSESHMSLHAPHCIVNCQDKTTHWTVIWSPDHQVYQLDHTDLVLTFTLTTGWWRQTFQKL